MKTLLKSITKSNKKIYLILVFIILVLMLFLFYQSKSHTYCNFQKTTNLPNLTCSILSEYDEEHWGYIKMKVDKNTIDTLKHNFSFKKSIMSNFSGNIKQDYINLDDTTILFALLKKHKLSYSYKIITMDTINSIIQFYEFVD